jgi:hypothetical protein
MWVLPADCVRCAKMGPMTDETRTAQQQDDADNVIVVGPDGRPMGTVEADGSVSPEDPGNLIEQPAKVMRIGSMIKQLLEEVRAAPRSIVELEDGLAPELREELERLSLPFEGEAPPSESELRIAQAQLVGWLEGLFHGIQAALVAQQMAARLQLEQMRGGRPALPVGPNGAAMPGMPGADGRTGQYL